MTIPTPHLTKTTNLILQTRQEIESPGTVLFVLTPPIQIFFDAIHHTRVRRSAGDTKVVAEFGQEQKNGTRQRLNEYNIDQWVWGNPDLSPAAKAKAVSPIWEKCVIRRLVISLFHSTQGHKLVIHKNQQKNGLGNPAI